MAIVEDKEYIPYWKQAEFTEKPKNPDPKYVEQIRNATVIETMPDFETFEEECDWMRDQAFKKLAAERRLDEEEAKLSDAERIRFQEARTAEKLRLEEERRGSADRRKKESWELKWETRPIPGANTATALAKIAGIWAPLLIGASLLVPGLAISVPLVIAIMAACIAGSLGILLFGGVWHAIAKRMDS